MDVEIWVYRTQSGKAPFKVWFSGLRDLRAKELLLVRLDRLEKGVFSDCRSVGRGVFEIRIFFGPGYRIYFGFEDREIVVLLCGGDKSDQNRDIKKAQEYWYDQRTRRA